jgi:glycosyltransferase involved in cell wall biosynthesis
VHLIRQENTGVREARRAGAATAAPSSEYLVFLDADDMLHHDFVRTMSGYLDDHPEVGCAYCAYVRVDQDGESLDGDRSLLPRYVVADESVCAAWMTTKPRRRSTPSTRQPPRGDPNDGHAPPSRFRANPGLGARRV